MSTSRELKILLKRKIPFLTNIIWKMILVLLVLFCILDFFMLPAKYASLEMSTAYFILVVPEWVKTISGFAFLGLVVFIPLFYFSRLKIKAKLKIVNNVIFIKTKRIDFLIDFAEISCIYFNDIKNHLGKSKQKLQIVIKQKNMKTFDLLLVNYNDAKYALEKLSQIESAEFIFYNMSMQTIHDEE